MNSIVKIAGKPLPVREYQGQRVVTIKDIAELHKTEPKPIRNNFCRHKKRFEIGIDYFYLNSKADIKLMCPSQLISKVNVFTETGYLMLVKSMTDDLAWKVQRQLVNLYFSVRTIRDSQVQLRIQNNTATNCRSAQKDSKQSGISVGLISSIAPLMKNEYRKILYYRVVKGLTQYETGKILGKHKNHIIYREKEMKEAGIHIPSQIGKRQNLMICSRDQQLILSN